MKNLKKNNITFFGVGNNFKEAISPVIIDIKNIKICLYAFSKTSFNNADLLKEKTQR